MSSSTAVVARGDLDSSIQPFNQRFGSNNAPTGFPPENIPCTPFPLGTTISELSGSALNGQNSQLPPIQWTKVSQGTTTEIVPILGHDVGVENKQCKIRVFGLKRGRKYYFPVHVCNLVVTAGSTVLDGDVVVSEFFGEGTLSEQAFAKTIAVSDDKALPPGVKVLGDYGQGPASIVFDHGGFDYVGVAVACIDASNATTNAAEIVGVGRRFR